MRDKKNWQCNAHFYGDKTTQPKAQIVKIKRPTSFEVARLAGVSRTTVSFVLDGVNRANISAVTQARVHNTVCSLGYVPAAAGRTLASGRTHTLGLFICHAEHLQVDALYS